MPCQSEFSTSLNLNDNKERIQSTSTEQLPKFSQRVKFCSYNTDTVTNHQNCIKPPDIPGIVCDEFVDSMLSVRDIEQHGSVKDSNRRKNPKNSYVYTIPDEEQRLTVSTRNQDFNRMKVNAFSRNNERINSPEHGQSIKYFEIQSMMSKVDSGSHSLDVGGLPSRAADGCNLHQIQECKGANVTKRLQKKYFIEDREIHRFFVENMCQKELTLNCFAKLVTALILIAVIILFIVTLYRFLT